MSSSPETWNERYSRGEGAGEEPDRVVVKAAGLVPTGFALDLACGKGRNAIYLAKSGFSVLAVDFSEVAIAALRGKYPNLDARVENLEEATLPVNAFDLICNIRYLQRSLFPTIRRALKPGGIFAASIAMRDDDPAVKPMNPAYLLAPGELREVFSDYEILLDEERKAPGHRRMAEFIARSKSGSAR